MPSSSEPYDEAAHAQLLSQHEDALSPQTPTKPSFRVRRLYMPFQRRRTILAVACSALAFVFVWSLTTQRNSYATPAAEPKSHENDLIDVQSPNSSTAKVNYPPWVLGAPTQSFRDNLRPEFEYITSWLSAGWSKFVSVFSNDHNKQESQC